MPQPSDDYDSPWKSAITSYFPEFMAFYFPQAYVAIDWRRPHVFLDKELEQVVRDAELGKRLADKLVQVTTRANVQQWVLVHVEVQGGHDSDFAERMFTYNYRIYDRYRRPVASLAILADDGTRWRPSGFGYRLFGCNMRLHFPVVKLNDFADRTDALLDDTNPFALVTAAHLLTQASRGDSAGRHAAKWRLTKMLYRRNWDRQRIIDLFRVIDWMMRLPPELETRLWRDIQRFERRHHMAYMTSVERIGLEQGLKRGLKQGMKQGLEQGLEQGVKKGLEQGLKQGHQEGLQEGVQQGQAMILERLLATRFGALPKEIQDRLATASNAQLAGWAEAVLNAPTLAAVFQTG